MQQGDVYAFLVCAARSLGAGSDPGEDIGDDGTCTIAIESRDYFSRQCLT
jgi:hypothetical protein